MDWKSYKEKVMEEIKTYADMPVTPHTAESMKVLVDAYDIACIKAGYSAHKENEKREAHDFAMWMEHLENADGTRGAHWSKDQTEAVRHSHGINADPELFWVGINVIYSDLCRMMQRYGIDTTAAYADFANAFWFEDADAAEDKLREYREHCTQH